MTNHYSLSPDGALSDLLTGGERLRRMLLDEHSSLLPFARAQAQQRERALSQLLGIAERCNRQLDEMPESARRAFERDLYTLPVLPVASMFERIEEWKRQALNTARAIKGEPIDDPQTNEEEL